MSTKVPRNTIQTTHDFQKNLIIRETDPSHDTSAELEMIAQREENVEVNCLNEYGHTALGTAAFVESFRCCDVLIHLGADASKRGEDGWTATHYAMAGEYLDIVKYLILCGGDIHTVNNDSDSPLEFIEDDEIRQALLDCFEEQCSKGKLFI